MKLLLFFLIICSLLISCIEKMPTKRDGNFKYSAVLIDKKFLNNLLKNNIINKNQQKLIIDFKNDPMYFGRKYLLNNPKFLYLSLKDKKNSTKVKTCITDNTYNLDLNLKPFNILKEKII